MTSTYRTETINNRRWVWHNECLIGALSYNSIRAYVFPLYSPQGVSVLQECPADHLHHQGITVGQDEINGHNFWAMIAQPPARYPKCSQRLIEESPTVDDNGVSFVLALDWITEDEEPILREQRTVRLSHHGDFNKVSVQTTLTAAYGALHIGQTKEGGIGMRVNPLLETEMGGRILDSEGRLNEAQIFDQDADWIDVSGDINGQTAGILMRPGSDEPRLPWFVRDYGVHLHGPRRQSPLDLAQGESVSLAVHFLAHDGVPGVTELNDLAAQIDP